MIEKLLLYLNPLTWMSAHTLALIGCLIFLLWLYIQYKWKVLEKYGISGPPPTLMDMGNVSTFTNPQFFYNDQKLIKKYGNVVGRYTFTSPRILIADPDILKQVMIKEFKSFPDRQDRANKCFGKEFNRALTQTSGESWKRQRSALSPTFSSSKMKEIFPILQRCIDNEIGSMQKIIEEKNGIIEAKIEFGNISMNCIIQAAFGTDMGEKQHEVATQMRKLLKNDIVNSPWFLISLMWKRFEDIMDALDWSILPAAPLKYFLNLSDTIIQMRKEHGSNRVDLLQLMLDAETSSEEAAKKTGKGLTRTEIKGQTLLFFLAGYETTATTMQFLSYHLATHPDLQEKLRSEINEVLEQHGGKITYESIRDMKYLEMCMNETLRFYPIVPANSRVSEREVTINGVTIPKGAFVDIPVYALLRSPDHWDDPDKFIPERMEDLGQIDPLIFQPFGAGPRICIGMRFAQLEIKLTFVRLLQEFRLLPSEETPSFPVALKFSNSGTMEPCEKIIFKLEAL